MIKGRKIVLATRSNNTELTEKAQSLFDTCDFIDERIQLKLKQDWHYLNDCIYNTDADITISIDDDFFLLKPQYVYKIIEYVIKNNIEIMGPECSTVKSPKPIIDSWFHISNNELLKKSMPTVADRILIRTHTAIEYYKKDKSIKFGSGYCDFDKHEFFFLLMVNRGCTFTIMKKSDPGFEILKVKGEEFGLHTRNGRYYKTSKKQMINEIYDFVRSKYHEKHFDNF